ncbi:hypothetical protein [Paenibacillus methanolicus]|uniref:Tail assembly chaperone n=1 Tax=Paenibacillus methanolicus TaxID=582686 RepID=A0A5S5BKU0_9BACL|nr:hypothetical protein [Paenibacillus methanolicus]TYP67697.1 hypothetical protein BCM02_12322 [Paenibacillus methanolicus]
MAAANNNDVVIVELDRPRELRFGHKALKRMMAFTGKSVEEIEGDNDFDMEELETIFFHGLSRDAQEHGENLTLDMMEDILDYAPSMGYLMQKMQEAFQIAMRGVEGNTPAAPKTVAPTAKPRRR